MRITFRQSGVLLAALVLTLVRADEQVAAQAHDGTTASIFSSLQAHQVSVDRTVLSLQINTSADAASLRAIQERYDHAATAFNRWASGISQAVRDAAGPWQDGDSPAGPLARDAVESTRRFFESIDGHTGSADSSREVPDLEGLGREIVAAWGPLDRETRELRVALFLETAWWEPWDAVLRRLLPDFAVETPKSVGGRLFEAQRGDPPQVNAQVADERLYVDELEQSETLKSFRSEPSTLPLGHGQVVDSKRLALETLRVAKAYAQAGVSRLEPPDPSKVRDFLQLYGLKFVKPDGDYVPFCAAGVGYAAARALYLLTSGKDLADVGTRRLEDELDRLRESIRLLHEAYFFTDPSVEKLVSSAKGRQFANGDAQWVANGPQAPTPQPGWLVVFRWESGQWHVGLVDQLVTTNGYRQLKTVEFNTSTASNANGGTVAQRDRTERYVVGYVRTYPAG